MRKSSPLVSIGMPVHNCERTLAASVQSILNQTFERWELLIVDDGSTDRTIKVAQSFQDERVRVVADGEHKGLAPRLNQGVAMSCGRYFARMDGDDVAYPARLERQVEYLEQHPEVDLLGCSMLVFKGNGVAMGYRPAPETHERICRRPLEGFPMGHPTWMGPTAWFRAHPYDAHAIRAEDQVLLLRSYKSSRFASLPDILCGYREEKLVLGKILQGRYGFARAAFGEYYDRNGHFRAIAGLSRQFGKALLDTMAVVTGLSYVVLPHRARSLDSARQQRWAEVWFQLQDSPQIHAAGKCLG